MKGQLRRSCRPPRGLAKGSASPAAPGLRARARALAAPAPGPSGALLREAEVRAAPPTPSGGCAPGVSRPSSDAARGRALRPAPPGAAVGAAFAAVLSSTCQAGACRQVSAPRGHPVHERGPAARCSARARRCRASAWSPVQSPRASRRRAFGRTRPTGRPPWGLQLRHRAGRAHAPPGWLAPCCAAGGPQRAGGAWPCQGRASVPHCV